jgi:hypothetical protein
MRNIDAARRLYERLDDSKLADEVVYAYFAGHPENTEKQHVVTKVVLLDRLFSTRLRSPIQMARHIEELAHKEGLDRDLETGVAELVDRIALIPPRRYRSFSSKYAHFHNADAFPLLDSYVEEASKRLYGKPVPKKTFRSFLDYMKSFREEAGLTSVDWRTLDKFLWLYGQKKALDKGKKNVGKEVKELYQSEPTLFEDLEP